MIPNKGGDKGSFLSREGYEISLDSSRWKLSRDVVVGLEWTADLLDAVLQESFISLMAQYAAKFAPGTTLAANSAFKSFARHVVASRGAIGVITPSDLINYRSAIGEISEPRLGGLGTLLKVWSNLGLPGVDGDVVPLLDGWRIKGWRKGVAVQTKCPLTGPLSEFEYEALCLSLVDAFETDQISLEEFVLVDLSIATGRRPVQLGDLKVRDIVVALKEVVLNVPRRKQGDPWRTEFKPIYLAREKGMAVQSLVRENADKFRQKYPGLVDVDLGDLPLFPSWRKIAAVAEQDTKLVVELLPTEAFHLITAAISRRLEAIIESLDVSSERTGERLRVFPLRLRRNIATRAARQGYGSVIIAELLDHTDDQNARVYAENVPEHVDAINEAVARQLAPIAQAFSGVLVDYESRAIRGQNPTSRVRTDSGSGVGTCGMHGFCGALAPIACYTCKSFQPWLDGPHQEVLDGLLEERERIRQLTRDESMAAINDRTVVAVAEVIRRCEERRTELDVEVVNG
jgi:integrase